MIPDHLPSECHQVTSTLERNMRMSLQVYEYASFENLKMHLALDSLTVTSSTWSADTGYFLRFRIANAVWGNIFFKKVTLYQGSFQKHHGSDLGSHRRIRGVSYKNITEIQRVPWCFKFRLQDSGIDDSNQFQTCLCHLVIVAHKDGDRLGKNIWPVGGSNSWPSDLESDALPIAPTGHMQVVEV